MNKDEIKRLFRQYQNNQCTPAELEQLRSFLASDEATDLMAHVWDDIQREEIGEQWTTASHSARVYQHILEDSRLKDRFVFPSQTSKRHVTNLPWLRVAAIVLMVFGIGWFAAKQSWLPWKKETQTNLAAQAVVPGRERAKIILDNGTTIDLDKLKNDTLITQEGVTLMKQADGSVRYAAHTPATKSDRPTYHTIVTPKGGEYQIELPDGTRVWLNAQTSLRYPVQFQEKIRQVELEGEAYFDVAKLTSKGASLPFIVITGDQQLEVLGTAFNINSFNQHTITTLVEGKVKLQSASHSGHSSILHPNQQSVYHEQMNKFTVTEVDPLYATAWRDGNFSFDKANIKEVMSSIARWYDVVVAYQGAFAHSYFSGTISKFEQIDKLLETIALTGGIHFKREGRRITVME